MADHARDAADLTARWSALVAAEGLSGAGAAGARLIDAYSEPHRRYHGLGHLRFLLDEIGRQSLLLRDVGIVSLAAWWHDAVYDPQAKDNEERSADWARRDLELIGLSSIRCEAVSRLILMTKSHHAGRACEDEALFLDMDFAILGATRGIYGNYAAGVRSEYASVPDAAFRAGRVAFLKSVLNQPRMFRTDTYEEACGARARSNIAWEIGRLESGAPLQ